MLDVLFDPVHFGRIILLDAARVIGVTTIVVFTPPFAVVIKVIYRLFSMFHFVEVRWLERDLSGEFMSLVGLNVVFALKGMGRIF